MCAIHRLVRSVMCFCAAGAAAVAESEVPVAGLGHHLMRDTEIQRHFYSPGTGERVGVGVAVTGELVYSNTGGTAILNPRRGRAIADDVITVAVGGCRMPEAHVTAYEILVGVRDSEETGDTYTVEFAVYDACPGAVPPGEIIGGTEGSVVLEDDGALHLITVDLEGADLSLPSDFWVRVSFQSANEALRDKAGWIVGSRADIGFTRDVYDYPVPSLRCRARLAGTGLYAGFYINVYCAGEFDREFLAYHNPGVDGLLFDGGAGTWVADDIQLIVDQCELSSLDVAVIGTTGMFNMNVELWDQTCNKAALIEGSQRTYTGRGDGDLELPRFSFVEEEGHCAASPQTSCTTDEDCGAEDECVTELHGLAVGGRLWLGWKFNKVGVGAIAVGEPVLGESEDIFGILDANLDCGHYWFGGDPYAAFNATFRCIGEAPRGACCDLSDPAADEYCRDSTEFGCSDPLARWSEGADCNDSDAFDPPCGYSACCVPPTNPHMDSEGCVDLPAYDPPRPCATDADCPDGDPNAPTQCAGGFCESGVGCMEIVDDLGNPAIWYRGNFCTGDSAQECFRWVCRYAGGPCTISHLGRGCGDPLCCDYVCELDPYCCDVEWDGWCVVWADSRCDFPASNDDCQVAVEVPAYGDTIMSNRGASIVPNEGFCCHAAGAGTLGVGSIWAKFVATRASVRIDTCDTHGVDSGDSLIQLFAVGDPTSDETACDSLIPIACNDDSECADGHARVDAYDLDMGATYYVLLASKTPNDRGVYRLTLTSPSPVTPSFPPGNFCRDAQPVSAGTGAAFDLQSATLDCPTPACLAGMENDVWFELVASDAGLVTIDTCGPDALSTPDTTLIVYRGADCPPSPADAIACNDDAGADCGPGSSVMIEVEALETYLIRVGGKDGSEPNGTLNASQIHPDCQPNTRPDDEDLACGCANVCDDLPGSCDCQAEMPGHPGAERPDECDIALGVSQDSNGDGIPDECGIVGSDPPDDAIDVLQPFEPDGTDPAAWQQVTVEFEGETSLIVAEDFDVMATSGTAPEIVTVEPAGTRMTLVFDTMIPIGAWTKITHNPSLTSTCLGHLPGDVNGDRISDQGDVQALIDCLDGAATFECDVWNTDMDRSGEAGPADILRLIDLLNGAGVYLPCSNVALEPFDCP